MFKFNSFIVFGLLVSTAPAFAGEIKNPITSGRYSCLIFVQDKSISDTSLEVSGPVLAPGAQIDQLYVGKNGVVRDDGKSAQNLNGKMLSVLFVSTDELTHDQGITIWTQNVQLQSGRVVKFLSPKMASMGVAKSDLQKVGLSFSALDGIGESTIECVPSASR